MLVFILSFLITFLSLIIMQHFFGEFQHKEYIIFIVGSVIGIVQDVFRRELG